MKSFKKPHVYDNYGLSQLYQVFEIEFLTNWQQIGQIISLYKN